MSTLIVYIPACFPTAQGMEAEGVVALCRKQVGQGITIDAMA